MTHSCAAQRCLSNISDLVYAWNLHEEDGIEMLLHAGLYYSRYLGVQESRARTLYLKASNVP